MALSSPPPVAKCAPAGIESPVRMARAKEWTEEVEDSYRLQEAGYKDEREALALGHPPIERWPDGGFIKKLITKESLAKSVAGTGESSTLYFRKARECEAKDLSKIKLYEYS